MEGWSESLRLSVDNPITSIEFDSQSNLLWTGNDQGYVNSYSPVTSTALYPYTKFKSSINVDPVIQMLDHGNKVYSLSSSNININNKRGIPIFNLNSKVNEAYQDFNCMALNDITNDLIINKKHQLFKVDLNLPNQPQYLDIEDDVSFIHSQAKFITLGKRNGSIDLFDVNSNQVLKQFTGHNNGLSDLDVNGNYLVTSGFSIRHNNFFVDPLVNVYDLRMMKLLPPIPFPFGPSFVRFHPKLPNIVLIGSKLGNLQFLDIFDQSQFQMYQIDLVNNSNYLSNMKISGNGEHLVFNDSFNNLIMWDFNGSEKFVNFPMELDGPSSNVSEPSRRIPLDDENVPLNVVGMPYYKDLLLSNFGNNLIFTKELSKLPLNYDSSIPYMKFMENKFDNNFNKYIPLNKLNDSDYIPFISDSTVRIDDSKFTSIPNCYNKLLIKYSKFGIEDFNFYVFNKTPFSGLENNLDNSYLNSILQLYKYQPDFQNLIIRNLFNEWLPNDYSTIIDKNNYKGSSLLNELGYLYDMLNKANGKNIKISNFSEFLNSVIPKELLNFDDLKSVDSQTLKTMILNFNTFFLSKLLDDLHNQDSFWKEFSSMILIKYVTDNQVNATTNATLLTMPDKNLCLVDYLNYSLKNVIELPRLLSINVNFNNREFKLLNANWLTEYIHTQKYQNFILFSDKPSNHRSYKLLGYVAEVHSGPETSIGNHNLITFININNKWYLFNDFLVKEINKQEVLEFQRNHKKPLILLYQSLNHEVFHNITQDDYPQINDSILYRDHFALRIRQDYVKQYRLLTNEDPPAPGSLIAMDAEFVILEDEKFEINSLGVKKLIQPKKLSLARISVIRQDETPFIDDYIIHTQPIKNYITSFSGIEPGDLDPIASTKNLVTLQTSYRRLWLLLNLGCVFIGHGLQNDFRTINIHVPKRQIRDTLELFFLPEFKRKLSLKFLSYAVLGEKVQTGNHDSIEDAKFALKLYKKYQQLQQSGKFESTLDMVYMEGQRLKFRVPED